MSAYGPVIVFLCFTCGLLSAGAAPVDANGTCCPEGWTQFGSRCFIFFHKKLSWIGAEKACIDIGGNLVSIHNRAEDTFVINLIDRAAGDETNTAAWIGGYDAVEEGVWLWSDGSKSDYQNWAFGEPNNPTIAGENCILVNLSGRNQWFDGPCGWSLSYVCSRGLPPKTR